jgi:hypothetical protein
MDNLRADGAGNSGKIVEFFRKERYDFAGFEGR